MRSVVGFFTHLFDSEILSRYRKLEEDLVDRAQTKIVAEAGTRVPKELRKNTFFFDFPQLASNVPRIIGSKVVPGNCHLAMLAFFRGQPEFDYYWHVEYDVVFTGAWGTLLDAWSDDTSDLVAPHLRTRSQEPDWHWWSSLQFPHAVPEENLIRAFLPVYRISRRALESLEAAVRDGYSGHFEAVVPTALQEASLRISDLGNGQFYTSSSSPDGQLRTGTMRYRPYHAGPLSGRNLLYHPVKSKSTRMPRYSFARLYKKVNSMRRSLLQRAKRRWHRQLHHGSEMV